MATLKNHRTIESGRLWNAYFSQANSERDLETTIITTHPPFGNGWPRQREMPSFEYNGKTFVVKGYDHFNAHFSGFRDESAIYALHIAEVEF